MELLPDGGCVRLRSRACDTYLRAEEDGVGVSLSPFREPRTAWLVRHVQRQGTAYVLLLDNPSCGHYLALANEPAPPGARGLRAVQRERGDADSEAEMIGVTWSARLAGGGGRDVLLRHAVHGDLRPLGCTGAGVVPGQGVRGLLPLWSLEAAPPPQLLHPAVAGGDAPDEALALQQGPVVVGDGEEVDLPAPDAAADAEADRLAALEHAIRNKTERIDQALDDLRRVKQAARATGKNPERDTVRGLQAKVVLLCRDQRYLQGQAAAVRNTL